MPQTTKEQLEEYLQDLKVKKMDIEILIAFVKNKIKRLENN